MFEHQPISNEHPIAIVGNINVDIKTSPIAVSDRLFSDGETSVGEIYEVWAGARQTRRLPPRSWVNSLCACVGYNELGARIDSAARGFEIITHLVQKNVQTGRWINLNWENSHRHFISSLQNNRILTADDIDVQALAEAGCGHLLRADIWFSESMLDGGHFDILKKAKGCQMGVFHRHQFRPRMACAGQSGPHRGAQAVYSGYSAARDLGARQRS